MRPKPKNILEEIDPELQWAIDNEYRTNPNLRDDILGSIEPEESDEYVVNVEHGDVKLKFPPEKILEKLVGISNLGNVVTTMRGGNGVAVITDQDKVIKITGDKAEYITAKELQDSKVNKHIVTVYDSKVIDVDDQSIYAENSKPAYLIVMDKLDAPTPQQEKDWVDCCCSEDKPIYVDFTDPDGDAVVHPPVADYNKCNKIYEDIINIRKEVEKSGRRWVDIGIDNVGVRDGRYVLIDLGTNDPLPLNESKQQEISPRLEIGDKIKVIEIDGEHVRMPELFTTVYEVVGSEFWGGWYDLLPEGWKEMMVKGEDGSGKENYDDYTLFYNHEGKTIYDGDVWIKVNSTETLNESKEQINEGFFDILSSLFKTPEQESDTPDELKQYLQQLQDTLDENQIYDEEVSKLVDELKDSDYIDLVDFPTMLRGLKNKLLKSGDKNEIVIDYLTRLNKSLPKRAKYEQKLLQGQVPSDSDYYDEVEQEKSRIPKKVFKKEKELLQIELLKLQEWVKKNNVPVAVVFEGRDTAGKGSTIKKLTEYLDPKYFNIVALGIPSEEEKKNWFQRYENYIEPGKITFFDRSWYNRGIVEPVMGYSSKEEYEQFMKDVVPFEKSLLSKGVVLIKFWLSITQGKQEQRFTIRQQSPLKYWKYSPNDEASREKWDEYTDYKERVLKDTSHNGAPWVVLDSNDKRMSALNAMRHLLDQVEYDGKDIETVRPKYPEAITTIRRKLDEQNNTDDTKLSTPTVRILQTVLNMSTGLRDFSTNLQKYFKISNHFLSEILFITQYNMYRDDTTTYGSWPLSKEKRSDVFNVSSWEVPTVYEMEIPVLEYQNSTSEYDDCDEEGFGKVYGYECECNAGRILDEDDEEYRPCNDEELADVMGGWSDCECEEYEDVETELYFYEIHLKTIYSVLDPRVVGCTEDLNVHFDDIMDCLDTEDNTVRIISDEYQDDTDWQTEYDFEYGEENKIVEDFGYDVNYHKYKPSVMINTLNRYIQDTVLGSPPKQNLNEEQLSMFPTGEWRLPVGDEDELERLEKIIPEPIVKVIFQRWDKEQPLRMDNRDFKLFGVPDEDNLLLHLIVRYLQNTTRPIPVSKVWDCDDLINLFNRGDREIVEKFLCSQDYDYDNLFGYEDWYDGLMDGLDDMSWKYITTLLGVDKSTAENLLSAYYHRNEEEEKIFLEKEDDIDRIKDLIRWANERAASDTTYNAIRENIKDEIEEHFENEGKFDYDSKGNIVYEIEGDLKYYVQDPDTWDNIERFNNHEEFRDRHLQDILYDFNLKYHNRDGFQTSIPDLIFEIFLQNDFSIWWDSEKEELDVDGKFFDSYWYPDYDFNEYFRNYMEDEYYDKLKNIQPSSINESDSSDTEFDPQEVDDGRYVVESPPTKQEISILNLVYKNFSITELETLVTEDYNTIPTPLESKWENFVKLVGENFKHEHGWEKSIEFAKSTKWAKWVLDNMDKAEKINEEGEIEVDFNNVSTLYRNYPSVFEVRGDEGVWEKIYRQATVEIPAFDREDAKNRAEDAFWEYEPDMETYDYGDMDTDYFNIEDIDWYSVLSEQVVDTKNSELSPNLVEGDKVFVWDVEADPAAPGAEPNKIPSTFIGVVTEVIPDDIIDREDYRGGIKYVVDTPHGLIGLYQGVEDYDHYADDGGGRDKWVKLSKEQIVEIKKFKTNTKKEVQKDYVLKKSFIESIEKLTEKNIQPVKGNVIENRKKLFNYLDELNKNNLINEKYLSHFLIGGKDWVNKFSVVSNSDLDDLQENSEFVRNIIFNNTKLKLDKKINKPSFLDTKRNLLEAADNTVKLWKENLNSVLK